MASDPEPRSDAYFATSAAGAKEATSTRRNASRGCVTERAQKTTLASAPPGVPTRSETSWGGLAPGRLGREDARTFGSGSLPEDNRHVIAEIGGRRFEWGARTYVMGI